MYRQGSHGRVHSPHTVPSHSPQLGHSLEDFAALIPHDDPHQLPIMEVCLSVCPFVCLSICLSVCLSVCLSACPFICLSVCLSVCMYIRPCVHVYVCMHYSSIKEQMLYLLLLYTIHSLHRSSQGSLTVVNSSHLRSAMAPVLSLDLLDY